MTSAITKDASKLEILQVKTEKQLTISSDTGRLMPVSCQLCLFHDYWDGDALMLMSGSR